mmetsp:Transcript_1916/g.1806  ORF Transcript_1916/g.1806 Transcript_1916/m.1806 type:complete len:92 (-) Transcript_1916:157-432(-)
MRIRGILLFLGSLLFQSSVLLAFTIAPFCKQQQQRLSLQLAKECRPTIRMHAELDVENEVTHPKSKTKSTPAQLIFMFSIWTFNRCCQCSS